ncbi:MAG: GNAT family N-acetyltransferase [Bacteriovorax sp.]|nr:GNAT family N-acetyltransferase [Bacteriovorax sp.]
MDLTQFTGQPTLHSSRLILEPIDESHTPKLYELYSDTELHHFVPFEPISIEQWRERCARWATRKSFEENELWLNWLGRDKETNRAMAHFQVGIKEDGVATIGYLVSRTFQGKGLAYEGLLEVFAYLRDVLGVREVKAWSDSRNTSSHKLAKKLGMLEIEFIKDADFFKGSSSDEFVFSKMF